MVNLSLERWISEEEQDGRRWGRWHLATGYPPAHKKHVSDTSECVSEYVCVGVCVYLQPVQLGPQAALVRRLFELDLDPRQEVPPHRAGKWLTHHHDSSTEVHLMINDTI